MEPKEAVLKILKKETKLKDISLEVPPDPKMGDFAFPCFVLAKTMKKSPVDIAKELASKIKISGLITEVKAVGPYLNFFVDKQSIADDLLNDIVEHKKRYGIGEAKKEKLMVEFSGPNPFKGFHIGHLRNTVIGESLVRILKFSGYNVTPVNYLNDTGKHVAKCLWGMETLHNGEKPEGDKGEWLGQVYSDASILLEKKPEHAEEVDAIHQKLEKKHRVYVGRWEKGKKWSNDHFNRIYKDLGVSFDKVFYDSEYVEEGKKVVKELINKGIAETDDGAIMVNLEKYKLHKVLVLRTDETALYITKDLAMAMDRLKKYKIDRLIYVVGAEQKLHFQQVFKILELYGFEQAEKCHHLAYELVRLQGGKMSSRAGEVVLYSKLKEMVLKKLEKEVAKRHKDWKKKEKEESVKKIFTSAIKFDMLIQDPNKVIVFDVEKALNFEGETGPYVQYTHARICSILKKVKSVGKADTSLLVRKEEEKLITLLSNFPKVVSEAAESYKPSLVARYLIDLSQRFNEFYTKCQIVKTDKEVRDARVLLIKSVKQVLENGLDLLSIVAPKQM